MIADIDIIDDIVQNLVPDQCPLVLAGDTSPDIVNTRLLGRLRGRVEAGEGIRIAKARRGRQVRVQVGHVLLVEQRDIGRARVVRVEITRQHDAQLAVRRLHALEDADHELYLLHPRVVAHVVQVRIGRDEALAARHVLEHAVRDDAAVRGAETSRRRVRRVG